MNKKINYIASILFIILHGIFCISTNTHRILKSSTKVKLEDQTKNEYIFSDLKYNINNKGIFIKYNSNGSLQKIFSNEEIHNNYEYFLSSECKTNTSYLNYKLNENDTLKKWEHRFNESYNLCNSNFYWTIEDGNITLTERMEYWKNFTVLSIISIGTFPILEGINYLSLPKRNDFITKTDIVSDLKKAVPIETKSLFFDIFSNNELIGKGNANSGFISHENLEKNIVDGLIKIEFRIKDEVVFSDEIDLIRYYKLYPSKRKDFIRRQGENLVEIVQVVRKIGTYSDIYQDLISEETIRNELETEIENIFIEKRECKLLKDKIKFYSKYFHNTQIEKTKLALAISLDECSNSLLLELNK
ncbi:hypothetical protein ND860_18360 [Leptospira levettii]|uniref:YARHG domain-containing protein n=1 Tax=Leptospira levettii TaxID=2023178 RepID=A0AAW5VA93_9LEPT|nr:MULTISPECIES: hypothetical protein [Leptospira]MCW7467825.1 hypothetical protein [Leptospira levettii]MCW7498505.1 hypothetical protein [Leptospira levettii]MCW7513456.1 hypothetical protein [Leptospira levettii]MCW7517253.1 hypothetical protein [Leptospira levettii]TGL97884.1 hypothetical protein EHQ79_19130 [Leptospira jelokensis]